MCVYCHSADVVPQPPTLVLDRGRARYSVQYSLRSTVAAVRTPCKGTLLDAGAHLESMHCAAHVAAEQYPGRFPHCLTRRGS